MQDMILNLTQHMATPEQIEAGVVEPSYDDKVRIRDLLTFDEPPTQEQMRLRAQLLCDIVDAFAPDDGDLAVMIGGAPYFMPVLERVLDVELYEIRYSFTKRVCVESSHQIGTSGPNTVTKTTVFRHAGWVVA